MDVKEMAKMGGDANFKKHGRELFVRMGKKSWEARKKKYGEDYMQKIWKKKGIKLKEGQI